MPLLAVVLPCFAAGCATVYARGVVRNAFPTELRRGCLQLLERAAGVSSPSGDSDTSTLRVSRDMTCVSGSPAVANLKGRVPMHSQATTLLRGSPIRPDDAATSKS